MDRKSGSTTDRPGLPRPRDASAFLTAVIAIYAVLLSVYGVLLPPLVDRRPTPDGGGGLSRREWWPIVILIVVAVIADLGQLEGSLIHLYSAGAGGRLDAPDVLTDVLWTWGPLNVAVIVTALYGFITGRPTAKSSPSPDPPSPPRRRARTDPGYDRPASRWPGPTPVPSPIRP